MSENIERNFGEQPIASIMLKHKLVGKDLVLGSKPSQLTFKMLARACKGRKLTLSSQVKVRNALNKCTEENYSLIQLFSYASTRKTQNRGIKKV